jgi:hypothetical protein
MNLKLKYLFRPGFMAFLPLCLGLACSQTNFQSETTKGNLSKPVGGSNVQEGEPVNLPSNPILPGDPETIPGVAATKVGIHFEDGRDNDYNDVSVCFDAPFKIETRPGLPSKVVMAEPLGADVNVYLKSLTGSIPRVTIKIFDANGKSIYEIVRAYTRNANSDTENPVGPFFTFRFPFGSRILVQYEWHSGSLNTDGAGKVKVEPNLCRNTGR